MVVCWFANARPTTNEIYEVFQDSDKLSASNGKHIEPQAPLKFHAGPAISELRLQTHIGVTESALVAHRMSNFCNPSNFSFHWYHQKHTTDNVYLHPSIHRKAT